MIFFSIVGGLLVFALGRFCAHVSMFAFADGNKAVGCIYAALGVALMAGPSFTLAAWLLAWVRP